MDTPNTPGSLLSPADLPDPSGFSNEALSATEVSKVLAWTKEDLASGKITEAQAAQAFDQLGVPVEQRGLQPDQRSVDQVLLDESFKHPRIRRYILDADD